MGKLVISKTQESDIDAIVAMENDQENSQYVCPNSINEHKKLLLDENIEHLLLKSDNKETIGFVILAGIKDKNRSIELRRIIIKQKGKGYGRKAIREMQHFCFKELKCHRLWLDVFAFNERARHLYLSENFKEEGRLRDVIFKNDKFNDLVVMSILESEYEIAKTK